MEARERPDAPRSISGMGGPNERRTKWSQGESRRLRLRAVASVEHQRGVRRSGRRGGGRTGERGLLVERGSQGMVSAKARRGTRGRTD